MILAIAGGTGSGKTTVSRAMKEKYSTRFNINVEIISMDNYYKNEKNEVFENYDHPQAFDMDLLYSDLSIFLSTGNIARRSYDYVTKESHIVNTQYEIHILILEGLYSFYETRIRDICSIKLFLDVHEDIRLKRRIMRDLKERGITPEENLKMIDDFVNDMHRRYILKQKTMADKLFTQSEDILALI